MFCWAGLRRQIGASAFLPVMLAVGRACWLRPTQFLTSLLFITVAALSADSIWYVLGKVKGIRILQFSAKFLSSRFLRFAAPKASSKQGARSLSSQSSFPGSAPCSAARRNLSYARPQIFLYDGLAR